MKTRQNLKIAIVPALVCLCFTANADESEPEKISHRDVQSFPDNSGERGFYYQPTLQVLGGCVPFPAVQSTGEVSGGLKDTGSASGGCSGSTGQVYVRAQEAYGMCAFMYSWYFPKDGNIWAGHRHDWENVVVWLESCDSFDKPVAVSYSAHGGYTTYKGGEMSISNNTHARVKYYQSGFTNFELGRTPDVGGKQPLISWGALPSAAREALENADFGKAGVPFKNSKFDSNLEKAYNSF